MVLRVAYELIKRYLCNIMQYVSYDGHISGRLRISCGVPQGSALGPQLFKMYVNDMCNVSKQFKCILFADDHIKTNCNSTSTNILFVPSVKTNVGPTAFSVAAPTLWNSLPVSFKSVVFITTFRRKLKTQLF